MNNTIFYFFYNFAHQSKFTDDLIIFCAKYLPYLVFLGAVLFLLFHHEVFGAKQPLKELLKKWKEILWVFFAGGLAWVVSTILKIIIHTSRPFLALPDVHSLFTETGYAFPSGHATFYSAIAVALYFGHKKVGYVFMFLALVIGFARIASGVHFPVDILAGFIIGTVVAYFVKSV